MLISEMELTEIVMPKKDPKWKFALGANPECRAIVIKLTGEDGSVGYGLASEVTHIGYPLPVIKSVLQTFKKKLVNADANQRKPLLNELKRESGGCLPALSAIDMALYDLIGKSRGIPVYQLLGGSFRSEIPVVRIMSIKSPEEMARNALELVKDGYQYLKIKVDNEDLNLDISRIAAIREAVGKGVHLTLDANQSYTPKEAVQLYEQVKQYRIDLFEQPVKARDFEGLKYVTENIDCIVEADESASDIESIFTLVKNRMVDSISLKLNKLGGIDQLQTAAEICLAGGIQCRIGAHVGSRLLNAAAMHFVAATINIDYACEVGEFVRLNDDPFEGMEVINGIVQVSDKPGLGVEYLLKNVNA